MMRPRISSSNRQGERAHEPLDAQRDRRRSRRGDGRGAAARPGDARRSAMTGGTTEIAKSTRSIQMGVGKSVVLDLPRDAAEIVVGNPAIANAVVRTPRKDLSDGRRPGSDDGLRGRRAGPAVREIRTQRRSRRRRIGAAAESRDSKIRDRHAHGQRHDHPDGTRGFAGRRAARHRHRQGLRGEEGARRRATAPAAAADTSSTG